VSRVYNIAKAGFLDGSYDLTIPSAYEASLWDSYTYDPEHDTLSDVSSAGGVEWTAPGYSRYTIPVVAVDINDLDIRADVTMSRPEFGPIAGGNLVPDNCIVSKVSDSSLLMIVLPIQGTYPGVISEGSNVVVVWGIPDSTPTDRYQGPAISLYMEDFGIFE